jgi:hypothetical protein
VEVYMSSLNINPVPEQKQKALSASLKKKEASLTREETKENEKSKETSSKEDEPEKDESINNLGWLSNNQKGFFLFFI